MMHPILIAETPRAGGWNHRYLVPLGCEIDSNQAAHIVSEAQRSPDLEGPTFVAATSAPVRQVDGRNRMGTETLVLYGIDLGKLNSVQKEDVRNLLWSLLNQLAILVTEQVDWNTEGRALVVRREELSKWQDLFSGLPTIKAEFSEPLVERGDKTGKPKKAGRLVKMTVIAVGVAIGLYSCGHMFGSRVGNLFSGPHRQRAETECTKNYERLAQDLKDCGLQLTGKEPNSQARELSDIICRDAYSKSFSECRESSSSEEEVRSSLGAFITTIYGLPTKLSKTGQVGDEDKIHPLAILKDRKILKDGPFQEHLGSLIGVTDTRAAIDPSAALGVRRALQSIGQAFMELQDAAGKVGRVNLPVENCPFAKMVLAATNPKLPSEPFKRFGGLGGLVEQEPKLPVFSERDWYLADILIQFLTDQSVFGPKDGSEKLSLKKAFEKMDEKTGDHITQERLKVQPRVSGNDSGNVGTAYDALYKFTQRVRDNLHHFGKTAMTLREQR